MKKKLYLFGVLTALASSPAIADDSYVTVNLTSGSMYSYLLSSAPKISYSGDSLLVSGPANASFLLSDVASYNFTQGDLTNAATLRGNEIRIIYVDNSHVKAEGLEPNTHVALYSVSGTAIQQTNANEDGVSDIELPQAKGVYILKTDHQTVKLIKE